MVRAWKTMAANGLPQLFSDFDSQLLAMVREAGVDGVDPDGVAGCAMLVPKVRVRLLCGCVLPGWWSLPILSRGSGW